MATVPHTFGASAPVLQTIRSHAVASGRASSVLAVTFVSCTIVIGTLVVHPGIAHWFLLPLIVCGVLIGTDAVDWVRGKTDLFDPTSLISLLGYHFFFIAPILMIVLDWRMRFLSDQPEDYRNWLGALACLNIVGILVYQAMLRRFTSSPARLKKAKRTNSTWKLSSSVFWTLWVAFFLFSLASQIYIFISFGGISGYINSYTAWLAGQDEFQGSSLLFVVGEALPILAAIGFAVWASRRKISWPLIVGVLLTLWVLEFFCGGLRGSRSNVIWTLFWIAGIFHSFVRRFPRVFAYGAFVLLYAFVSIYASYKQHGNNLFESVASSGDYGSINETAEGPATVLVGDFSRADVQSYLLSKLANEDGPKLAFGRTYLGAITMLVPKTLWPGRPPTILKWTTEAEYGAGAYDSGVILSSRVYGIAGEAMLNFGLLGVPLAYAIFGLLVATLQNFANSLPPGDSRLLILPFLLNLLFVLLLNDSDNTVFYVFKYGLMPGALIFFASQSHIFRGYLNAHRGRTGAPYLAR